MIVPLEIISAVLILAVVGYWLYDDVRPNCQAADAWRHSTYIAGPMFRGQPK